MSELLKPGRPVYVKSKDRFGEVYTYDNIFGLWIVHLMDGNTAAVEEKDLEPLFTLNQVVATKIQEDDTPALVNKVIPFGMTSDELASEVAHFIAECAARVKGVGKDQYNVGTHQKFEELELDELFEYAEEELRDICNYTTFLAIRIRRIRAALYEADDLGRGTEEEYEGGDIMPSDFEENGNG